MTPVLDSSIRINLAVAAVASLVKFETRKLSIVKFVLTIHMASWSKLIE